MQKKSPRKKFRLIIVGVAALTLMAWIEVFNPGFLKKVFPFF